MTKLFVRIVGPVIQVLVFGNREIHQDWLSINTDKKMRAILYLTLAAVLWGGNFHLAKIMMNEVEFIEAGFWRYILGVLPLFFWLVKNYRNGK